MKSFYNRLTALLPVFILFLASVRAQDTQTFTYTGSEQTFTVPAGVTMVHVIAFAATGGAGNSGSSVGVGGKGGKVEADLAVTPGQTLYIYIGGKGIQGGAGGFNGGGGTGQNSTFNKSGGGGGATDIRIGGNALNNRVLVAGGGGGCGAFSGFTGGAGGGLTGGNGGFSGGTGGTPTAGGSAGGALGLGGSGTNISGGGGGYYGGGRAGASSGGGGGGSSYTDPSLCSNVVHTQGASDLNSDGSLVLSWTISCTTDPVVQNTNDSGAGSLRQAIMDACAGSTITFDPSVFSSAQTITLTSGTLNIQKNLTITGPGADKVTINQTGSFTQVFTIQDGHTVSISGLKMTGGQFGGVYNYGSTVTLTNCELSGNTNGAAVSNSAPGEMTLTECVIKDNPSGGILNFGPSITLTNCELSGNGGSSAAVSNSGTGVMMLTDCVIKNNTGGGFLNFGQSVTVTNCELSGNGGSSAAAYNSSGTLTMSGTTIKNNTGGGVINFGPTATITDCEFRDNGGINAGVYNSSGEMTLTNCTVKNHAPGGVSNFGTKLTITDCQIMGNGNSSAFGGGIYLAIGTLNLTNSTVSGNTGNTGGGLNNFGTVTASNTRFTGNTSTSNGGAIYHGIGTMTLTNCTVADNMAASGAGIYSFASLTVTGSTISNNTSSGSFNGGGISANGGSLTLTNSTISGNSVTATNNGGTNAGGLWLGTDANVTSCTITGNSANGGGQTGSAGGVYRLGGNATFKNTIIAGNTGTNSADPDLYSSSAFTSGGYNLIGDGTGATGFTHNTNNDLVGTSGSPINALLGSLANNGGPTQTHALLGGSPAIDNGNAFSLTTDQRGVARPQDDPSLLNAADGSDIGAVDMACPPPTAFTLNGGGRSCDNGVSITLSGSETGITYQLIKDGNNFIAGPVEGTGDPLDFGDTFTEAGIYTVVATRTTWVCTSEMTGRVIISPCFSGLGPTYCADDTTPYLLTGSEAPNGTFSGPGVIDNGDGTATFTPSTAGTGGKITYTVLGEVSRSAQSTDEEFSTSTSQNVAVHLCGSALDFSGLSAQYCDLDESVTLVGSYAPLGFFTGPGITNNGDGTATFDPGAALLGDNTVRYLLTDNVNTTWANISTNYGKTLAVKTDGTLWAWGYNGNVFGNGNSGDSDVPLQIGTENDWLTVSLGLDHVLALKSDGSLWAWGSNTDGQLGVTGLTSSNIPVRVGTGNDWVSISAGFSFSTAIKTDGTLWAWGFNFYGQLGDGSNAGKSEPVQVGADTDWQLVKAGTHFTLALKNDGTMWSWGYNDNGRLGLGPVGNQNTPVQIGMDTDWRSIATNISHSLALKSNGTLWAWGNNLKGQLGLGSTSYAQDVPVSLGGSWIRIAAGSDDNSFAIKEDGTLWASGNNQGAFGNGGSSSSNVFVQVGSDTDWDNVFCGDDFTLAIKADGTLYGTGYNLEGQLGNGNKEDTNVFTRVVFDWTAASVEISKCPDFSGLDAVYCRTSGVVTLTGNYAPDGKFSGPGITDNGNGTATFDPAAAGTGGSIKYFIGDVWTSASAGAYHAMAVQANGSLLGWGYNYYETIGDGSSEDRYVPVVSGNGTNDWAKVSAGYYHSLGLKTDGTLWAWGYGEYGELGNGADDSSDVPVQVGTDNDWAFIKAGNYVSYGIKTNGTLWAWGYGDYELFGDGTSDDRNIPVQIGTDTDWASVSNHSRGGYHTLAIKTDGTLWAWGSSNDYGQFGDGTTDASATPVRIGTDTDWASADAGVYHSLALKTDGTLWAWGYGGYGEMGNGTTDDSLEPIQVGTETNWASTATGYYCSIATKTDGTLWAWGYNDDGELGNGTYDGALVPVQSGTATNWASVWASYQGYALGLQTDGSLWAWGYQEYGELGDGQEDVSSNVPVLIGTPPVSFSKSVVVLIAPTEINSSNISAADCKNTTCTTDDTFTADITVSFTEKPGTGTLSITGPTIVGTVSPVSVDDIGATSYTFTGVTLKADGEEFELTATFSEGCAYTDDEVDDAPACEAGEFEPSNITVSGFGCFGPNGIYTPAGTLNGAPMWESVYGPGNFRIVWTGSRWEIQDAQGSGLPYAWAANATGAITNLPCSDGWNDPLEIECISTGVVLSGGCGDLSAPAGPSCDITGISIGNMGACNDNGTITSSDDYFVAGDIAVVFAYAPSSGNLVIKRGSTVLGTKPASELSCVTEWLFLNVQMAADGQPLNITAEFTGSDCSMTEGFGNAPASCSCVPTTAFLSCPGSQIVNVDAGKCFATVNYAPEANGIPAPGYEYAFTGASNGFGGGTTLLAEFNPGVTNLKITATNDCGTVDCNITVTVVDNQPPTITCPIDRTVNADQGQCSSVQTYTVTNTDNCSSSVSQTSGLPSGGAFPVGITTNGFTATDAAGLNSNCSFKITVLDNQPPTITCPDNRTVNADAGLCSSVQTYVVTATDNCSNYTLERTNGFSSASPFPLGFNVVNWKVTDVGGNSSACSFSITVLDAELPTIGCPANIARGTDNGQCTALVNYTVNGGDNCGGWSLSRTGGLASGAPFPTGTTTVSWRNTDTGGNSVNCSFTVTVTESQAPTISCPANIVKAAGADCQSQVFYVVAGLNDNCPGVSAGFDSSSPTSGLVSGSSFPTGTSTVVLKATDAGGLTATCSFTVTITDNLAPTITCPGNMTRNTDAGLCTANVTYMVTASDNCSGVTTTMTAGLASGSNFPRGATSVTWRATDTGGRTATCSFRVTVNDRQAPVVSCPADQVLSTDAGLCTTVVNYASATFVDNCAGGSVIKISGPNSGTAFSRGATNVVFRATDAAGNSALCSMKVTISDSQLPAITCPTSIVRNNDPNVCNAMVTYATPTGTDNCAGVQVNLLSGLASSSSFPIGVTTVTWRAIDGAGLTKTCAFTVSVSDNQLPTITCPPATVVSGSGSPCGYASNQLPNPTASDNCAVTSLTSNAPTTLPAGNTVITWTAKDAVNNVRTCSYTVTVNCGAAAGDDAGRESPSFLISHLSSLSLSPNPASDIVVITLSNHPDHPSGLAPDHSSGQASNQQLFIHDALGRLVWARKLEAGVEQLKIDLITGVFEDGVYQVSLQTDDEVITRSLVVTKR